MRSPPLTAGAARQYSGTAGGIALCQVAVTLTYATGRGYALIGRALYLPEGCAADEEHRELAGVPEEVLFATKPQLAGRLLDRAHALEIRAAFVAGDEVYGGRQLRRGIRQRGMGYVLAVRANHVASTGPGRAVTAAAAARMIPHRAWHRMRTGSGTKGTRHYDWAMLEVTSDDTPEEHGDGHSVLLARRHRYTGTLSHYRCWTATPARCQLKPGRRADPGYHPGAAAAPARHRHPFAPAGPGPPPALVGLATPPPAPRPPSPPALECLCRDSAMITTNYSCRSSMAAVTPQGVSWLKG
jgi:SRSO17 transposase